MRDAMQIRLPWPPSINGYWRAFRGRQILSKRGREYRKEVAQAMDWTTVAPFGDARLAVTLWLYPPDRRRRDVDNHAKAVLDALVHVGLLDDDSQVDRLVIERCAVTRGGVVVVTIEAVEPVAA